MTTTNNNLFDRFCDALFEKCYERHQRNMCACECRCFCQHTKAYENRCLTIAKLFGSVMLIGFVYMILSKITGQGIGYAIGSSLFGFGMATGAWALLAESSKENDCDKHLS